MGTEEKYQHIQTWHSYNHSRWTISPFVFRFSTYWFRSISLQSIMMPSNNSQFTKLPDRKRESLKTRISFILYFGRNFAPSYSCKVQRTLSVRFWISLAGRSDGNCRSGCGLGLQLSMHAVACIDIKDHLTSYYGMRILWFTGNRTMLS